MNTKGSELSMNVIIIAAIAVLVLVILAVLLFGATDGVNKSTGCEAMNGRCGYPDSEYNIPYPAGDKQCKGTGNNKCYIRLGSNN